MVLDIKWEHSTLHITVKEMMPIIIIEAIKWGHNWKGRHIVACRDSIAVVTALNNRSCKNLSVLQMLRILFFIEAYYQFKVVSEHFVGSSNNRADYLFRDQIGLFYICITENC